MRAMRKRWFAAALAFREAWEALLDINSVQVYSRGFSSYILHKRLTVQLLSAKPMRPLGVLSQRNDVLGRLSVYDVYDALREQQVLEGAPERVGAVGRLDMNTTGLMAPRLSEVE